jgi:hypothetical protein
MKKLFLTLALLCATITTLVAQDITPSKNNFGVTLSTNIFGLNDELNYVAVGGGFYFSRKITNKLSIYSEIDGSSRNYGDLAIMPSLSGEFTTGNLAIYLGPMFDIGKNMNLSTGIVQNYLFNPKLKTTTGNIDVSSEVTNFTSMFFDFRHHFGNKFSIGTRYEWGLNSIFKNVDRKVSTISFNMFLPLGGKRSQNKGN